ncbi:MAG TPA: DUF5947 family protein [Trebonia sp.]|nr:DUF5947 family protein [Trebonia sp.]
MSSPGGTGPAPAGLRRFTAAGATRAAARVHGEGPDSGHDAGRCEMCRDTLGGRHGHVVDVEQRSVLCACRACYLLFTHEGSAGGRYRAVPERVCHDPGRPIADQDWNELAIPVAMAFFFRNSALGRVVAGYPSPGGATECELDLAAWDRLAATHPLLAAMKPDVEAIFVNRAGDQAEAFLIPVDECYGLVGELRLRWQGFDGGAEVRAAIEEFLGGLRRRAVELRPADAER